MISKKVKSLLVSLVTMFIAIIMLFPVVDIEVSAYNHEDDCRVIVSMGDSYSAGEGLGDYYDEKLPESQRKYSQDFLSHRSINSWPGMLNSKSDSSETMVNQKDNNWFFVAMSGAITKNIVGDGKVAPDPITEEYIKENKYRFKNYLNSYSYTATGINRFKVESCVPIDFQIDVFENENLKNKEIDYVTMTIGGNDVDFAGIVTTLLHPSCISPNVINDKLSQTYGILPQVQLDLKKVYETVSKKAGKQAHIIIAGYPRLLEPQGKGALISKGEATAVNEAIDVFNNLISATVVGCGDSFSFVPVDFSGHEVYSDVPWLYNYEWLIKEDDISDFSIKNRSFVSAASFHPNLDGATEYARLVNAEIERLEGNSSLSTVPKEPQSSKTDGFKCGKYLVEFDDVAYYVDQNGLWKNEYIGESELLHKCKATNIASNGEVIYYSVYNKESSAYCKEYGQDATWYQYDLYCYDLRTLSNKKLMSFIECGQPICSYGNKIYYTDRPDDFTGNVVGLAPYLYSFDLNTGEKELISEGAYSVTTNNKSIFFKDLNAAGGTSAINRFDVATGNIEEITNEKAVEYSVDDNYLVYTEYECIIEDDTNIVTDTKWKVTKYDLNSGNNEIVFEEYGNDIRFQYFDDEYIFYTNDSLYYNYRLNIKTGETTFINSSRWSRDTVHRVYKLEDTALYYHWDYFYFYELKDTEDSVIDYKETYNNGCELLLIKNDNIFMVYDGGDYYFYDIVCFDFDRTVE